MSNGSYCAGLRAAGEPIKVISRGSYVQAYVVRKSESLSAIVDCVFEKARAYPNDTRRHKYTTLLCMTGHRDDINDTHDCMQVQYMHSSSQLFTVCP